MSAMWDVISTAGTSCIFRYLWYTGQNICMYVVSVFPGCSLVGSSSEPTVQQGAAAGWQEKSVFFPLNQFDLFFLLFQSFWGFFNEKPIRWINCFLNEADFISSKDCEREYYYQRCISESILIQVGMRSLMEGKILCTLLKIHQN